MTPNAPKAKQPLWRTPWAIETVVFFLVLWQEAIRLELRTAHRQLPIPASLQDAYYYHFGDFANGYVNAFIIDGVTGLVARWAGLSEGPGPDPWWKQSLLNNRTRALAATALSSVVIIGVEVLPNALTQADWLDIPAGVAGALCYLGVRMIGLAVQGRG
jgi:hypothetical protein